MHFEYLRMLINIIIAFETCVFKTPKVYSDLLFHDSCDPRSTVTFFHAIRLFLGAYTVINISNLRVCSEYVSIPHRKTLYSLK